MFSGLQLTQLDLSTFNTKNVTNMKYMFSGSKYIQELDLSSFDTTKVQSMKRMFDDCISKSVDLSSFDMSNVSDVKDMFFMCKIDSPIPCRSDADKEVFMKPETNYKDLSFTAP